MIWDVHTHIFLPEVRRDRERFFKGEDEFQWIYQNEKARMVGPEDLLTTMGEDGVERSVVFSFPWRDPGLARESNDYVLESAQRSGGRLIPMACFDPLSKEAANETERCLIAGARGVGELALYLAGSMDEMIKNLTPVAELLKAYGWPLLIHTNEPIGHPYPGKADMGLKDIYDLVKAFSENTLILAHWGGGLFFYGLLKKEVPEMLKNVYYDTAASPFLYLPQSVEFACKRVGADKVLFGSDYPLIRPARYYREMKAARLDPDDLAMILSGNLERLMSQEKEF
ncbi:MAG: amidohydrolase [Deltaproteobacteria bacterium]|nr:amidohydrolase [Deltaproteobacteria bacterium]